MDTLLFNQKLPVSFPSSVSKLEVSDETADSDMMQISIGQGSASITPLQLNMITCAIANEGKLMKPYVVDCVKNSAGNTIKEFKPSVYGNLMTSKEAEIMSELMKDVVEEELQQD